VLSALCNEFNSVKWSAVLMFVRREWLMGNRIAPPELIWAIKLISNAPHLGW
jgi:hypothetical protein